MGFTSPILTLMPPPVPTRKRRTMGRKRRQPSQTGWSETHPQCLKAVEVKGIAVAGWIRQGQTRQALEQDGQRHLEFEPSQGRADAEVDAGAEADMGVGFARGPEEIGLCEASGIAIGGAKHEADLLALRQPDSRELDILKRVAGEEIDRKSTRLNSSH